MGDERQEADADANSRPHATDDSVQPRLPGARFERADWLSFTITAVLTFAVYLFTLAPNLTLGFSGILSTGAMHAGVPPPPGYPLWTIYSWLMIKLLPFSNIAWRVAVGSALAAAVACGLVALMVSRGGKLQFEETSSFSQLKASEQMLLRGVCGCIAGTALAFSGPVWGMAVIVETWTLSLLLFTSVLWLLMRWMLVPTRRRFLATAFFLFGLLLTNSQEAIVALPGMVCMIMLGDPKLGRDAAFILLPLGAVATGWNQYGIWLEFSVLPNWPMIFGFALAALGATVLIFTTRGFATEWRAALSCGFCFLLGSAIYFVEPILSMTNPPVNWGYPRTSEGFLHVISRGQYERIYPTTGLDAFAKQLWMVARVSGREFGWLYLPFATLPFVFARRLTPVGRKWMLASLTVFICVGPMLVSLLNPPSEDAAVHILKSYFALAYAVLAVWLGYGLIIGGAMLAKRRLKPVP